MLARLVPDRCPILFSVLTHVPNRDNGDHGILSSGSHGRVKPRRGMNVKTGVGGQVKISNNALEIVTIIVRKKEGVRRKLRVGFVHAPEEADDRTGESLALQAFGSAILRQ